MANRASGAYRVGCGWAGETSSVGRSLNATVPAARWMYLYPAIDQHGQVIDVLVSRKRDLAASRRFFTVVLEHGARPIRGDPRPGAGLPLGIDELLPAALHVIGQYATDVIEADHGKSKSRLRPCVV